MNTSPSIKLALEPDNPEYLANLCGQLDEHIKMIEQRLGIEIRNRGNNFQLVSSIDINWQDEQFRAPDLDPVAKEDAYTKVNASVTLGPLDGNWDISLIGKNLTDEERIFYANDTPLFPNTFQAAMEQPRSVSVRGRVKF